MNGKCFKSRLTSGFSLIELMVVIAIVALLTAIAVPSYKSYLSQSKVKEIFSLASDQMTKYQNLVNLGSTSAAVTTTNLGTYIASAVLNPTGSTVGSGNTAVLTNSVGILLNAAAGTGIDPALANVQMRFTPTTQGTSTDSTNTNITWTCTFIAASSATPATAASLLGSCGNGV